MSDKPKTKPPRVRLYDEDELPAIPAYHNRSLEKRDEAIRRSPDHLSHLEHLFVEYYLGETRNDPIKAALKAGYPLHRVTGKYPIQNDLLKDARVMEAIARRRMEQILTLRINSDYVMALNFERVSTPPPMDVIIPPCRYCWGENNQYQRTHGEFEEDYNNYMKLSDKKKKELGPFDEKGGKGYDYEASRNGNCPECHGRGDFQNPIIMYKDTRFMSPQEKSLFAGAEKTKNGFRMILHDQIAAMNWITKAVEPLIEIQRQRQNKKFDWDNMTLEEMKQMIEQGEELGFNDDLEKE